MIMRLLLLFTLVPLLELVVLIEVGQYIGTANTILLILATGVVGVVLARWQGLFVFREFKRDLEEGRVPGLTIVNGILVLVGSAFLLTPGLITDSVGFLLLLPPTRALVVKIVRKQIEKRINTGDIGFWINRR